MRSLPLCARLGLFLMALALAANLLTPTGASRSLPRPDAAAFPRQVGEWRSDSDLPLTSYARKSLPTATLIDRIYVNAREEGVEMALVSAARPEDAHDPEMCLPGSGWAIVTSQPRSCNGQDARFARVRQIGQEMDVLYWWYSPELPPAADWLTRARRLRARIQQHNTILVRLTTPAAPQSEAVLQAFAQRLLPALAAWKQTATHPAP